MNVLFAGPWDIAGAYISDRLFCEGHTLYWITEEPKRLLWNKHFKGQVYRGSWRREDYLRILKAHSIDTVVFLTGALRENFDSFPEYQSQLGTLTDLLNVLRGYSLKRLIYLSSLELDYPGIYAPVLTELAAGEMLCQAYRKAYALPILILRLGLIFGGFSLGRMGLTGRLLEKIRSGASLDLPFSSGDYTDTLFGEDLGKAVYRLLSLEKQGVYRVFSGHPLTFQEYIRCLGEAAGQDPDVRWLKSKKSPEKDFFLSDRQIKLETGWIPLCLLPEKGIGVLKTALAEKSEDERPEPRSRILPLLKKHFSLSYIKALSETLLLFLFTCFLLNLSAGFGDLKYVDVRLMFVAVISCLHGLRFGLLSILLASLSYIWSLTRAQIDISYLLYSVDTWVPFVVYGITGASISYVTDRFRDERESLKKANQLLQEKYEFLQSIHEETLNIKGKLQQQIITTKYSFGHAYEVAVELDSLKPELIILKVISILENIMDCKKAAIFLYNEEAPGFARLKACSAALRDILPGSLSLSGLSQVMECLTEGKIFVNTALMPDYPDYAAPLTYNGHMFAFAAIYDIGADKFTVYFQNLFRIITNLIEQNLAKALEYENARKEQLYYPGTELLYPQAFEDRLAVMRSESGDISYSFVVCRVYPKEPASQEETARRIASVIRGSDCMGVDHTGNYAVILVNMRPEFLDMVSERFDRAGLTLEAET